MFDMGKTFISAVERDPDALAVIFGDDRLTYGQWFEKILSVAGGLEKCGFIKGDVLITSLKNNMAFATTVWASQILGVFLVPVNWRLTGEELAYVIDNAGAKGIIFQDVSAASVRDADNSKGLIRICTDESAQAEGLQNTLAYESILLGPKICGSPRALPDDYAFMLYTSGTTGKPKGVPRSHRVTRASVKAHIMQCAYEPFETTVSVMPLYHTIGLHTFLSLPLVNGLAVMQDQWKPEKTVELIESESVTSLYLVPTLFHDLVTSLNFSSEKVKTVRTLAFAGSTMAEGLARKLTKEFKPARFVNWYGSSEIYTFSIESHFDKNPISSGKPSVSSMLRIVEFGSRDIEARVPVGTEGEIIADMDSDEAFDGYWNRPDSNEKSLIDGWYFTGDSGFIDSIGNLHVTGRVDDVIISGGENISPGEIENVLSMHSSVDVAIVIGHPDEKWGEVVAAYIKPKCKVSDDELDRHCRASELANFKRPRKYVFVENFPVGPTGKILRRELRSSIDSHG